MENMTFEEKYSEYLIEYNAEMQSYFNKNNVKLEVLIPLYVEKVEPYLHLIREEKSKEYSLTQDEIAMAFGITSNYFKCMKKFFPLLADSLKVGKSIMKFKAQLDLQKGVKNTEHKNAKMIEMQLTRYDDEYKPKGQETTVELPKTLEINIGDFNMSDEELEEFETNKEE